MSGARRYPYRQKELLRNVVTEREGRISLASSETNAARRRVVSQRKLDRSANAVRNLLYMHAWKLG